MTTGHAARAHAFCSPSGAHRWIACPASVFATMDLPDVSSPYAAEGTKAHEAAEQMLKAYLGLALRGAPEKELPQDMFDYCMKYADQIMGYVEQYQDEGAVVEVSVEGNVPIGFLTGEEGATGACDAIIEARYPNGSALIHVCDLKYGYNPIDAFENPQLRMYALGAVQASLEEFQLSDRVVMSIHQPRLGDTPSVAEETVEALMTWAEEVVAPAAAKVFDIVETKFAAPEDFNPGEKQCKYCKLAGSCEAQAAAIDSIIGAKFDLLEEVPAGPEERDLGNAFSALKFIEDWMKALRARVEAKLFAGESIPGVKLVAGRKGHRQWEDEATAEKTMKTMRLKKDEMYDLKLIPPTTAEKLLKDNPRSWKKVEAMIVQKDGSPSVVPDSDKRPALILTPTAEKFNNLED